MRGLDREAEIGGRAGRIDEEAGTKDQVQYRQCEQYRAQNHMHESLPVTLSFTMSG